MSNEVKQRITSLEGQVENLKKCILDNHEDMRRLANLVNKYIGEVGRVGNKVATEIIASTSAQCDAVSNRAQANIQEIVAQTKVALSPEKISEAVIAVATPEKIATELSKHILVTRPAQRGETTGVLVTRQATPAELRNQS